MPPWGNCHASWPTRRAHSTSPCAFATMMPTLGRKPSASITVISLNAYVKEVDSIVPQKPRAEQSTPAPVSIVLSRCDTGKLGGFWRMRWAAVALAIFDLDNTLLGGDSDHAWGE